MNADSSRAGAALRRVADIAFCTGVALLGCVLFVAAVLELARPVAPFVAASRAPSAIVARIAAPQPANFAARSAAPPAATPPRVPVRPRTPPAVQQKTARQAWAVRRPATTVRPRTLAVAQPSRAVAPVYARLPTRLPASARSRVLEVSAAIAASARSTAAASLSRAARGVRPAAQVVGAVAHPAGAAVTAPAPRAPADWRGRASGIPAAAVVARAASSRTGAVGATLARTPRASHSSATPSRLRPTLTVRHSSLASGRRPLPHGRPARAPGLPALAAGRPAFAPGRPVRARGRPAPARTRPLPKRAAVALGRFARTELPGRRLKSRLAARTKRPPFWYHVRAPLLAAPTPALDAPVDLTRVPVRGRIPKPPLDAVAPANAALGR